VYLQSDESDGGTFELPEVDQSQTLDLVKFDSPQQATPVLIEGASKADVDLPKRFESTDLAGGKSYLVQVKVDGKPVRVALDSRSGSLIVGSSVVKESRLRRKTKKLNKDDKDHDDVSHTPKVHASVFHASVISGRAYLPSKVSVLESADNESDKPKNQDIVAKAYTPIIVSHDEVGPHDPDNRESEFRGILGISPISSVHTLMVHEKHGATDKRQNEYSDISHNDVLISEINNLAVNFARHRPFRTKRRRSRKIDKAEKKYVKKELKKDEHAEKRFIRDVVHSSTLEGFIPSFLADIDESDREKRDKKDTKPSANQVLGIRLCGADGDASEGDSYGQGDDNSSPPERHGTIDFGGVSKKHFKGRKSSLNFMPLVSRVVCEAPRESHRVIALKHLKRHRKESKAEQREVTESYWHYLQRLAWACERASARMNAYIHGSLAVQVADILVGEASLLYSEDEMLASAHSAAVLDDTLKEARIDEEDDHRKKKHSKKSKHKHKHKPAEESGSHTDVPKTIAKHSKRPLSRFWIRASTHSKDKDGSHSHKPASDLERPATPEHDAHDALILKRAEKYDRDEILPLRRFEDPVLEAAARLPVVGVIDINSPTVKLPKKLFGRLVAQIRSKIGDNFPSEKVPTPFWSGQMCNPLSKYSGTGMAWPDITIRLHTQRGLRKFYRKTSKEALSKKAHMKNSDFEEEQEKEQTIVEALFPPSSPRARGRYGPAPLLREKYLADLRRARAEGRTLAYPGNSEANVLERARKHTDHSRLKDLKASKEVDDRYAYRLLKQAFKAKPDLEDATMYDYIDIVIPPSAYLPESSRKDCKQGIGNRFAFTMFEMDKEMATLHRRHKEIHDMEESDSKGTSTLAQQQTLPAPVPWAGWLDKYAGGGAGVSLGPFSASAGGGSGVSAHTNHNEGKQVKHKEGHHGSRHKKHKDDEAESVHSKDHTEDHAAVSSGGGFAWQQYAAVASGQGSYGGFSWQRFVPGAANTPGNRKDDDDADDDSTSMTGYAGGGAGFQWQQYAGNSPTSSSMDYSKYYSGDKQDDENGRLPTPDELADDHVMVLGLPALEGFYTVINYDLDALDARITTSAALTVASARYNHLAQEHFRREIEKSQPSKKERKSLKKSERWREIDHIDDPEEWSRKDVKRAHKDVSKMNSAKHKHPSPLFKRVLKDARKDGSTPLARERLELAYAWEDWDKAHSRPAGYIAFAPAAGCQDLSHSKKSKNLKAQSRPRVSSEILKHALSLASEPVLSLAQLATGHAVDTDKSGQQHGYEHYYSAYGGGGASADYKNYFSSYTSGGGAQAGAGGGAGVNANTFQNLVPSTSDPSAYSTLASGLSAASVDPHSTDGSAHPGNNMNAEGLRAHFEGGVTGWMPGTQAQTPQRDMPSTPWSAWMGAGGGASAGVSIPVLKESEPQHQSSELIFRA